MDELKAKRDELLAAADAITDAAAAETRGLTEDEQAKHGALIDEAKGLRSLMETRAARDAEAASKLPELTRALDATQPELILPPAPSIITVGELRDPVYHQRSSQSFFVDKVAAERSGDQGARDRLSAMAAYNAQEMAKRDLYDASTHGTEAVVPLYLQDRFEKARVGAAVMSQLTSQEVLPEQGESISIPYQTGNAAVASLTQASPLNTLQETDATFDRATETVVEIGGTQDISNFINERGNLGSTVDSIIANHLSDLLAVDEDQRVIAKVRAGAGVSVTYTATTGTLAAIYPKIADAIQQIHTTNRTPPTAIVVHPRRFAKWASELDSNNRPLMTPMAVSQNPMVSGDGSVVSEGFTGFSVHGLPIYTDANVGILSGAGTNEDTVYVGDWKRQYTWLGPVLIDLDRSLLFRNSGMTVRARRYFATMVAHRTAAFAKISGTGLATPTF